MNVQGQSRHHVHYRGSESSSCVRAAEESNTSEVDDSQVKTLEGEKPCLFMGMVAPGSQKYRVCVSAGAGLAGTIADRKRTRL